MSSLQWPNNISLLRLPGFFQQLLKILPYLCHSAFDKKNDKLLAKYILFSITKVFTWGQVSIFSMIKEKKPVCEIFHMYHFPCCFAMLHRLKVLSEWPLEGLRVHFTREFLCVSLLNQMQFIKECKCHDKKCRQE